MSTPSKRKTPRSNRTNRRIGAQIKGAASNRKRFVLSEKAWHQFNMLLDSRPREIPRLKRLLREGTVFEKQ